MLLEFSFVRSLCEMKYLMRAIALLLFLAFLSGIKSNASLPNVLLICVDDLRPELRCFGVDYIQSPHIDTLASQGRVFRSHYVQAPTCGASRYTLLTGRYGGPSNNALFQRATKLHDRPDAVTASMPAWFRSQGYTAVSVGKVSHHPGGLGGKDWNDSNTPEMPESWDRHLLPAGEWQHPRGWMHGLANGEIRDNAKDMDVFQSVDGPDTIYPDGISVRTRASVNSPNLQPQRNHFFSRLESFVHTCLLVPQQSISDHIAMRCCHQSPIRKSLTGKRHGMGLVNS